MITFAFANNTGESTLNIRYFRDLVLCRFPLDIPENFSTGNSPHYRHMGKCNSVQEGNEGKPCSDNDTLQDPKNQHTEQGHNRN